MFRLIWNFSYEGIDLYHVLSWFFVYSFFGWIWETTYVSVKSRKFTNRGFVFGPCLTIYGCGAVSVYMILLPFAENYLLLFFLGMILATILEYVTALLMETLFHTSWWDYSDSFCNFQGRICLFSSLFWGVLTILLFRYFQPFVSWLVDLVPRRVGIPILTLVIALYLVDFILSCIGASGIAEKLEKVNGVLDDFGAYLKNTQVAFTAKDLRKRAEEYRSDMSKKAAKKRLERNRQSLLSYVNENEDLNEIKDAVMDRFEEFKTRFLGTHQQLNRYEHRILRDYPHLGRGSARRAQKKKERLEQRQKAQEQEK